jgi:hypothetical protein
MSSFVIPAKAGIPLLLPMPCPSGTPAFAGVTVVVATGRQASSS